MSWISWGFTSEGLTTSNLSGLVIGWGGSGSSLKIRIPSKQSSSFS